MKKIFIFILFSFSCALLSGNKTSLALSKKINSFNLSKDQLIKNSSQSSPDIDYLYTICVCAIFKDEAPYFKEWIEYYKMLGVEHFRLYNNDSEDNYLEVLAPYIQEGSVTLLDWPSKSNCLGPNDEWVWTTQLSALSDAIIHFRGISKWLAIIDLDEFILPLHHSDLPSFLEEYEPYAGVLINWLNFGTSRIWDIPSDKLLIETLTLTAPEQNVYNQAIKSIVRPDRVDLQKKSWCPHTWSYSSDQDHLILPNHQKWKIGMIDMSKARINHYVHRTELYFHQFKVPKRERMSGSKLTESFIKDWTESCNVAQDTEIFRFVSTLRERVFLEE